MKNRIVFKEQIGIVVDALSPSGIIVYGPATDDLFESARSRDIPIYQYDSYMMKRNRGRKEEKK